MINCNISFYCYGLYLAYPAICVKITTGTIGKADGKLIVKVGSTVIAKGRHKLGAVVTDSCFSYMKSISLRNPSTNAWKGEIAITYDGKSTSLRCKGCTGKPLSGAIVVDGNSDGKAQASTQCLNGNICKISWVVTGKQYATCFESNFSDATFIAALFHDIEYYSSK